MLPSPCRRLLVETVPLYYPYGNAPAQDALEGFDNCEPADDDGPKILFLGCSDLKSPLATAVSNLHTGSLEIHVNDVSLPVIGRNILVLKVITSKDFHPDNAADMSYVWNLWYNATWPESTTKRFIKDVRSLLDDPLPEGIVIPKANYKAALKDLWTKWLTFLKTRSIHDVLSERSDFFKKNWTLMKRRTDPRLKDLSFSEALEHAVRNHQGNMMNDMVYMSSVAKPPLDFQLTESFSRELRGFYKTGTNFADPFSKASHPNPTLLRPDSGEWIVHYALCPLDGYQPLPMEVLDGTAFAYCRNELKKLLKAFRKRMRMVKFFFHPCDGLTFCYDGHPDEFDVIDASNVGDQAGLLNMLNAAGRKLRSDHSVLITRAAFWFTAMKSVVHYVQEVLCCPLSLIPTLYGLRLADSLELGSETIHSIGIFHGKSIRIRWMKTPSLEGVPLILSPTLKESLDRLKTTCFTPPLLLRSGGDVDRTGRFCYSLLTYRYVLSDLIHRTGISMDSSFFAGLPPVLRKAQETIQAWMEHRPVWQVKIRIPYGSKDQPVSDKLSCLGCPPLRLILVPQDDVLLRIMNGSFASLADVTSTTTHFFDNLVVEVKMKSGGNGIDHVDVSFLLEDRSLLDSHYGIVMDLQFNLPIFIIGALADCEVQVDRFAQPYPWAVKTSGRSQSMDRCCQESEGGYVIRLKGHSGLRGLKVTADPKPQWPLESAHRITIRTGGVLSVPITLPHPIRPETIKTKEAKDGILEISVDKAIRDMWPGDFFHEQYRWDPEELEPWTDAKLFKIHVKSQFRMDYAHSNVVLDHLDSLNRIREIFRGIFGLVVQDGPSCFDIKVRGSKGAPDFSIRAHPPARISPQGALILVLTVMENGLADQLRLQGKLDTVRALGNIQHVFTDPSSKNKAVTFCVRSAQDIELLRRVFRLNSTKMRPTSWQTDKLQGEPNTFPWLCTFIRPLYREGVFSDEQGDTVPLDVSLTSLNGDRCEACCKATETLKRCSRCKSVAYCSVKCQKEDWKKHKIRCQKS